MSEGPLLLLSAEQPLRERFGLLPDLGSGRRGDALGRFTDARGKAVGQQRVDDPTHTCHVFGFFVLLRSLTSAGSSAPTTTATAAQFCCFETASVCCSF